MKSKAAKPEAHETHDPSPHEVVAYTCNDEAGLSGDDGRVEGVGETNHDAAEEQYVRTHTQPELEEIGEIPERAVKTGSKVSLGRHVTSEAGEKTTARRVQHNAQARKAAEASHEAQTSRKKRGREWAATIKSI